MKKMSEVFELPLTGRDMRILIKEETTYEDDDLIAHAINHVDALAGALDKLLSMLETESRQDTEIFKECEKASNAYWGIK